MKLGGRFLVDPLDNSGSMGPTIVMGSFSILFCVNIQVQEGGGGGGLLRLYTIYLQYYTTEARMACRLQGAIQSSFLN